MQYTELSWNNTGYFVKIINSFSFPLIFYQQSYLVSLVNEL